MDAVHVELEDGWSGRPMAELLTFIQDNEGDIVFMFSKTPYLPFAMKRRTAEEMEGRDFM